MVFSLVNLWCLSLLSGRQNLQQDTQRMADARGSLAALYRSMLAMLN